MPPPPHLDLATLDLTHIVADKEAIRRVNFQRYEMEQLDAIVYLDPVNHVTAGYRDVRPDEFWVRGHFPDRPVLPGVLLCEAGAQLCSYYIVTQKIMTGVIGFGGMDEVRFRGMVQPGDRLVLVSRAVRLNRRQSTCNVQGFVGNTMVFHGNIIGISLTLGEGT